MKDTSFIKFILALGILGLTACSSDDASTDMMYSVKITNLTANQPITPVAVVLHQSAYQPWALGAASPVGLEKLAEGGDTTDFITTATANSAVLGTATGTGIILPGTSETIVVSGMDSSSLNISLLGMLANTNDAFTGNSSIDIAGLAAGESMTVMTKVFDAGTEANTETTGSIPGPADMGIGYSATRDDIVDAISIHSGVISAADGLSTSVLDESHRWNGPGAEVTITRM